MTAKEYLKVLKTFARDTGKPVTVNVNGLIFKFVRGSASFETDDRLYIEADGVYIFGLVELVGSTLWTNKVEEIFLTVLGDTTPEGLQ